MELFHFQLPAGGIHSPAKWSCLNGGRKVQNAFRDNEELKCEVGKKTFFKGGKGKFKSYNTSCMYFYSSYCEQVWLSAALHGTLVKGTDFWAGQFGQTLTLLHMILWLFGKLLNSWSFQFLSHQVVWLSAWVRIKWDSAGKNLVEYLLRNSRILNTWKRLWSSINLSLHHQAPVMFSSFSPWAFQTHSHFPLW